MANGTPTAHRLPVASIGMGELYLVRHGQANTGATNEADYDRLSDLGHRQAGLLGDWLHANEDGFDLTLSGAMRRHRETAAGMGFTPDYEDPRLNEMDYFALARDIEVTHGVAPPNSQDDFADHIPQTLAAWHGATINGAEPFATFETRIFDALAQAAKPGKRVLCITSGGVIAMVMRQALGLGPSQMAHVLLPIWNSSLHRFRIRDDGTYLVSFNTIPHLDAPDLVTARTHI
ncbi:MAG: broad specificity phosphatase PhoE [Paracoccaceae bacterium]